jgi:hypothetical protein
MRTSKRSAGPAFVLLATLVAAPISARAARSAAGEAGLGLGCVFGNMLYGPTKMMYAFFGGFIGLVAYGLSAGDEEVAMKVIEPAWRGDYALTAEHLTGEEELEFIGRRAAHRAARESGGADDGGDKGSTGGDW